MNFMCLFPKLKLVGVILIISLSINAINAKQPNEQAHGVIFFAPDNTKAHDKMSIRDEVKGSEIFTHWGAIEKNKGVYNWNYIDSIVNIYQLLGKKVALRVSSASFSINDTPGYVYTEYGVRRIAGGYWDNFESDSSKYKILGKRTAESISGNYSIQLSAQNKKKSEQNVLLRSGVSQTLTLIDGYSAQFDYKVKTPTVFYARVYSKSLAKQGEKYIEWTAVAGENGMKTFEFIPLDGKSDNVFEIGIVKGDLTVDNINIIEMRTGYHSKGTLCFPDYTNDKFKQAYEVFVKALAEKYNTNPTIRSISVGGYGRWEEMTLCDDQKPFLLLEQWKAVGFNDDKYIPHIKWCMDIYKKYFTNKEIYICAVGYPGVDDFRDEMLSEWKVLNYAVKTGIGIKYNGWQSKCSEWASEASAFFYALNRFKHETNVKAYFEEGAQIMSRNKMLSEVMGHPISLLNRAIIDNIDYYWMYSSDIQAPYIHRYLHYANESAGSSLITKLYCHFGVYNCLSPDGKATTQQKNILMGLYQFKENDTLETTYTTYKGLRVARTNEKCHKIQISIDDRQKYNGMYGAAFTIDYLDNGSDQFKIYGYSVEGKKELKTVTKTNSNSWKSVSLSNSGWANGARNGGKDMLVEIEVDDCNDGIETLRSVEIEYVPAREWQEQIVQINALDKNKNVSLAAEYSFEIPIKEGISTSGISINVSGLSDKYINIKADVFAKIADTYQLVQQKDYYMPDVEDWFYIPLANAPKAELYKIVVRAELGKAALNLGSNGQPAYKVFGFVADTDKNSMPSRINKTANLFEIEALKPFFGILLQGKNIANVAFTLNKKLASGQLENIATLSADAEGKVAFEPQTAGIYQIKSIRNMKYNVLTPLYLNRLSEPTKPISNLVGDTIAVFADHILSGFKPGSGFKNNKIDTAGFQANIASENPELIKESFNIQSDLSHQFHFIIKNETNSSLTKVYWKTGKNDFCELNSVLIPIVPNDKEYREYSYPIGLEKNWQGNVSGLKFLPVTGHTSVGQIFINTIELRKGNERINKFR